MKNQTIHCPNAADLEWTTGKPETRQYKAVFFLGKVEIDLPSDVVLATAAP